MDWPDPSEPVEVWRDFAVSRGFRRDLVEHMGQPQIVEALSRLESESYDNTVY